MNKKTKVMLSSIATIAMTASLAIGGTYALFTSEDKVNIAVTSGAVDVRATTSELTLTSNGVAQSNGTFAVGGTATKVDNNITLDRIVPMDKVDFTIDIDNYSNVAVQYRTVINMVEDTGLFSALKVTFVEGGVTQTFTGGYAYSDWKKLTPTDGDATTKDDVTTIAVSVEFPDGENQNQYQNKTCKFAVTVEAVQGNASVVNPITKTGDRSFEINSEEGMMLMNGLINSTSHGEGRPVEFKLMADMDMTGYTWTPAPFWWVTLDGNGKTISNLNCAYDDWGRSGFAGYAGGATFKNLTFKNVTAEGTQVGVLAGAYEGGTIENVKIAGRNVLKYNVAINPQETWGGVGAVAGVAQYITTASSVTIESGATVEVNYNGLITSAPLQNAYAQISDISGIVTNNGTVTEVGEPMSAIADGFSQATDGTYVITSAAGLEYLATTVNGGNTYNGKVVKLANDIDLNNEAWTPIGQNGDKSGFQGTFDGNGKTISNLNVNQSTRAYKSAGLFGSARYATIKDFTVNGATITNLDDAGNTSNGAAVIVGSAQFASTISNVKVLNANVTGNRRVSAIAGYYVGTIENCYVENVTLTAIFDDLGNGSYDNADKVGTFAAYVNTPGATITGNEAKDVTIRGYRDIGGIVGHGANGGVLTNNKIDDLKLILNSAHNYKNYTTIDQYDIEPIMGEGTADATNVATNVSYNYEVGSAEMFMAAVKSTDKVLDIKVLNSMDVYLNCGIGGDETETVNIYADSTDVMLNITCPSASYNGSYVTFRTINPDAVMNFSNITLNKSDWSATTWNTYNIEFYTDVTLTDCVVKHPVTFCEKAVVTDTTILGFREENPTADHYAVWVTAYADVTITGGSIEGTRGIKVDSEYAVDYTKGEVDEYETKLSVEGTTFKTSGSKPAILVKLMWAKIDVKDVDISGVAKDSVDPVWIDEDAPASDKVVITVNGTVQDNTVINEKNQ